MLKDATVSRTLDVDLFTVRGPFTDRHFLITYNLLDIPTLDINHEDTPAVAQVGTRHEQ